MKAFRFAALMALAACARSGKKPEAKHAPDLVGPPVPVKDYGFESPQAFALFAENYYRRPDAARVTPSLRYYCATPWHTEADNAISTAAFFGYLFRGDEASMRGTFEALAADGSDDEKMFLLHSLWMAKTPAAAGLIARAKAEWKTDLPQKFMAQMEEHSPDPLLESPLKHPGQLDLLWMRFYATGDEEPVRKIASVAHMARNGHGQQERQLGNAAVWMLTSHAHRHEKVLEVCRAMAAKSEGPERHALEEVVREAEKRIKEGAKVPQSPSAPPAEKK